MYISFFFSFITTTTKTNPYAPLLLASSLSCSLLALIEVILADSSLPPYTFLSSSSISAVSRSEFISAAARSGILATSAPRRSTLGAMTHTHHHLARAPALLFFQRLFFHKIQQQNYRAKGAPLHASEEFGVVLTHSAGERVKERTRGTSVCVCV